MTEFNDELAFKLAKNDKQILRDWIVELEERISNTTDGDDIVALKRRLRIVRDRLDNCEWSE